MDYIIFARMQEVPSTLLSSLTLCGWKEDNVCPAWFLFFVFASERQLRRKVCLLRYREADVILDWS